MTPAEQLVDLIHADDAVRAFLRAADLLLAGEIGQPGQNRFMVGTGRLTRLKDVVALFERILAAPIPARFGGRDYREREVMLPWQGEFLPGWRAEISLEQGLRQLAAEAVTPRMSHPVG